ncbi:23S rRNA (adenine(2503)-C(2))-methyltransferase RlmN [Pectinatus frisingensis]|uniref:23S rRNA (adenine(2503)-C(2))-methyltransferase RlmN n=1 Tax=Pectinatus frisingensis TaxID=865 RepID=UPI0018C45FF3|nr:23S rRNA (adenine(2503)-C(2))-methyltransferase RlmN [Pectinatus frisingensis]
MTKNIFGLDLTSLQDEVKQLGMPAFRAGQILEWLYQKNIYDFSLMTNLSLKLREELPKIFSIDCGKIIIQKNSIDKQTSKFLVEFADKTAVETVLMRQSYGNSICISSQAGCKLGCGFCASTLHGFQRDLTSGEMLAQAMKSQAIVTKEGQHINNIVIMGSGEPLLNYNNVIQFIHLVHEKYCMNIGYRNITISTSGIVPMIKKLAEENLPLTLSISLHAPDDVLRSHLMPINNQYPLQSVIQAADFYAEKTKRRITYEYILIDHINDNLLQAKQLVNLLSHKLANVNLIPLNSVVERGFRRPSSKRIKTFTDFLQNHHINVTLRKEMGTDIDAACGQLRNKHLDKTNK